MGAPERREREREQRRQQILDAARAVVFEKGVAASTMAEIAARAELSVGSLYRYFQHKDGLFAALQQEGLDLLADMVRQVEADHDTPRARLRAVADAYFRFSQEHQKYFDMINHFLVTREVALDPPLKSQVDAFGAEILARVARPIGDLAPALSAGQAYRYAIVLWAALHGMLQFHKLRETILAGDELKSLYDLAVTRFIAGL